MTVLLRAMQANTPHHDDKTALIKPKLRPGAFYESIDNAADGLPTAVAVAEMWPGILLPIDGWTADLPFPNNRRPTMLGNGFVWSENVARKRPSRQVEVRIDTGSGDRTIHMPLERFRPLGQRQTIPMLAVHAPRMKLDASGNHRTHLAAIAKGQRVARRAGRCIVLGDPNADVKARYQDAGYQCIQHGVGFIAAIGDVKLTNFAAIDRGVRGVWSDHLLLTADVVAR
jgi:hypothetical protein